MPKKPGLAAEVTCVPATPDRWPDVERLFGTKGACGGCWCMYWRRSRKEFSAHKGEGNRRALRKLIQTGPPPGVLAYAGEAPVGWCAVAPRADYPTLARSRVLKAVDDRPVWSITCLFVEKAWRGHGVSKRLICAATELARSHGATIVEAYPIDPGKRIMPDVFVWTGLVSAYQRAGFKEVTRRSPTRPIVRAVSDSH